MAKTQVRSQQVEDGGITRDDLNTVTVGKAVTVKIIEGPGCILSSTGADAGTGDVTVNVGLGTTLRLHGRKTAGAGTVEELTITEAIDFVTGTPARGDILYRNASFWSRLAAGTSGQFLQTLGSSANPIWADAKLITATLAKSANFTVPTTERGTVYFVTTGASTITATLPSAASAGAGWHIILLKSDAGAGTIASSPAIASPSGILAAMQQRDMVLVFTDGSNYYAANLPATNAAAVTSISGTVNEITASSPTGAVTLSLPSSLTFTGKTVTGGTYRNISLAQVANGDNMIFAQRITDTAPSGYFCVFTNAVGVGLFSVNVLGAITASGTSNFAGSFSVTPTIAANTGADGAVFENTAAASSGNQMYSPRVRFTGRGWKTTATAASQQVDAIMELRPVQGAANPTSLLAIATQINSGGYTDRFTMTNAGVVNMGMSGALPAKLNILGGIVAGFNDVIAISGGSGATESGPSLVFQHTYGNTVTDWSVARITGIFDGGSWGGALVFSTHLGTDIKSAALIERMRIANFGTTIFSAPVRLMNYTVATLPAGTLGDTACVTDALAPAFLAVVVGGGAVKTPVFYNGTNWVGY